MTAKTLYLLIGPKGSGKTTIGALVDAHTDIRFIRVEPIWLSLKAGEDGWRKVEATIDAAFERGDKVMIESLGAGDEFRAFHASLKRKYTLKMIRVYADLATCLARVKRRDSADHIAVSDDKVEQYNRIAAAVVYDWDLEIDNNGPAADADVLAAIRSL
jgi:shikimate kinase